MTREERKEQTQFYNMVKHAKEKGALLSVFPPIPKEQEPAQAYQQTQNNFPNLTTGSTPDKCN